MTLDLTLIGLGWLLATGSAVLWIRKYPQQPLGRGYPSTQRRGWRAYALLTAAGGFVAFGGAGLESRHHWASLAAMPLAYGPVVILAFVVPVLARRRQVRTSAPHNPQGQDGAVGLSPTV